MGWIDGPLFISVLVTLFAIMDPPGTVPLFISLTPDMTTKAMQAFGTTGAGRSRWRHHSFCRLWPEHPPLHAH
jgi:hypothetical protein